MAREDKFSAKKSIDMRFIMQVWQVSVILYAALLLLRDDENKNPLEAFSIMLKAVGGLAGLSEDAGVVSKTFGHVNNCMAMERALQAVIVPGSSVPPLVNCAIAAGGFFSSTTQIAYHEPAPKKEKEENSAKESPRPQ